MRFSVSRDQLVEPLQLLMSVVDKRQTLPVLSNLLFELEEEELNITSSDQEIELNARVPATGVTDQSELTVPARKFFDICRNLQAESSLEIQCDGDKIRLQSGRFSSQLKGLPAYDFPRVDLQDYEFQQVVEGADFRSLLSQVEFAMAHQDVRYFFNGLLLEFSPGCIGAVATNGQRLAKSEMKVDGDATRRAIIPRKAVAEILKIVKADGPATLSVNDQHFSIEKGNLRLTTKLIDAEYPDYRRAIPGGGDKRFTVDRMELRSALVRISIVSNELYRNVRLQLTSGQLQLAANNPMHDEAEELLAIDYEGQELEIGFNVTYLIDALNHLRGEKVEIVLSDPNNPALIVDAEQDPAQYVVSPMVL